MYEPAARGGVSVTGRMSDNPADSLRRELDERQLGWLVGAAINKWQRGGPLTISEHVARDLWPPLMAWAEAIRADERERIEAVIHSVVVGHYDPKQKTLMERVRDRCAELVAASDGN